MNEWKANQKKKESFRFIFLLPREMIVHQHYIILFYFLFLCEHHVVHKCLLFTAVSIYNTYNTVSFS